MPSSIELALLIVPIACLAAIAAYAVGFDHALRVI